VEWEIKKNDFIIKATKKKAHEKNINSIVKFNDYYITCSNDELIKIWN